MTQARKRLVSYTDTVYYHCVSRCVRRAFLCGNDSVSGFDFNHRRGWIVTRITELARVFSVDVCAYAVMSNHYHVVLRIDLEQADQWSEEEVAERWCKLFHGPHLLQRWRSGALLDAAEQGRVQHYLADYRDRLKSLSWFMRCLNERIARMANAEDGCKGRFWEGRFKSQALLDEKALLSCMAYVDLNPIRAAMARTPEHSDYTSIQTRIRQPGTHSLRPFSGTVEDRQGIPYSFREYLELVDWSSRAILRGKRGHIPQDIPPILERLNMAPAALVNYLAHKQDWPRALGAVDRLRSVAAAAGAHFFKGTRISRTLFATPA
jgi:REP element-mobilizing transposase RayT